MTPGYEVAFEASRMEFELARQLIETRVKSALSQGGTGHQDGDIAIDHCAS